MEALDLSDEKIDELLKTPKRVVENDQKPRVKDRHTEYSYKLISERGDIFKLYVRQNIDINGDFSCSIYWEGDVKITLVRYNGNSHPHKNIIEKDHIKHKCHIHKATNRYISAGRKPEGYAQATDRYNTLREALDCLIQDCFIKSDVQLFVET